MLYATNLLHDRLLCFRLIIFIFEVFVPRQNCVLDKLQYASKEFSLSAFSNIFSQDEETLVSPTLRLRKLYLVVASFSLHETPLFLPKRKQRLLVIEFIHAL